MDDAFVFMTIAFTCAVCMRQLLLVGISGASYKNALLILLSSRIATYWILLNVLSVVTILHTTTRDDAIISANTYFVYLLPLLFLYTEVCSCILYTYSFLYTCLRFNLV